MLFAVALAGSPAAAVAQPQNLIANPSFEQSLGGWGSSNATLARVKLLDAPDGAYAVEVTQAGSQAGSDSYSIAPNPDVIVSSARAGVTYTASVWVKGVRATAGRPVVLVIRESSRDGELARASTDLPMSPIGFGELSVGYTARRTGDRIDAYVYRPRSTLVAGDAFLLDEFRLTAAGTPPSPALDPGALSWRTQDQIVTGAQAADAPATGHVASLPPVTGLCPSALGSFGVGSWPGACWRPYGPSSPFNRPLPPDPRLAPDSTQIISYIVSQRWSLPADGDHNFTIQDGSRPVYWSQPSDPLVTVSCRPGYRCQPRLRVRIPAGALPEQSSDAHLTVVDQAQHREYDFWEATAPAHARMTVSAGNSIPIGPDLGTGIGAVAEGAYLGLLGGLVRAPELFAGHIDHALAMSAPCVQPIDVWPSPRSGRGDRICPNHGAGPHFGSLLQLTMSDAQIAASNAPAWQQAVMLAMAHYGIYVVDANGPNDPTLGLMTEADLSFTTLGLPGQMNGFIHWAGGSLYSPLSGVPIDPSKLRVIDPCVAQGTC